MEKLKILLAKGRIYESVYELLNDVGISIHLPERTYFPTTNQKDLAFQVVKPQITSALLAQNKADVGFSGKDWVYENGVENSVVEIMDLGFDPVRIVAAIPETVDYDELIKKPLTIATEYQSLSRKWAEAKKIDGSIFRTWGTKNTSPKRKSTAKFSAHGERAKASCRTTRTPLRKSLSIIRQPALPLRQTALKSWIRLWSPQQECTPQNRQWTTRKKSRKSLNLKCFLKPS